MFQRRHSLVVAGPTTTYRSAATSPTGGRGRLAGADFYGADVAGWAEWAGQAALVGRWASVRGGAAVVDRRAAVPQRLRHRRPAVVGQRAEARIGLGQVGRLGEPARRAAVEVVPRGLGRRRADAIGPRSRPRDDRAGEPEVGAR